MTVTHPLPDALVQLIAQRFRVLSDPTRIKLLDRLREGESSVHELTELRQEYTYTGLSAADLAADPIEQFRAWFRAWHEVAVGDPNAMVVATAAPGGRPSVRTVLLRAVDGEGFVFDAGSFRLAAPADRAEALKPYSGQTVSLGIRPSDVFGIDIHPPTVLFGLFVFYGLSGYVVYAWKKRKGRPVSVIATSMDEPDEQGLHE